MNRFPLSIVVNSNLARYAKLSGLTDEQVYRLSLELLQSMPTTLSFEQFCAVHSNQLLTEWHAHQALFDSECHFTESDRVTFYRHKYNVALADSVG